MKTVFSSLVIAFSMYSKIPMPRVEWTEENRKYAICFFPLVGLVTGGLCYVWFLICGHLQAGTLLFSAGMAAIPLFLTGGIHVDGFMDTMDAMHSYLPREEKLRILKDSHIGAFSVICLLGYYLTYLGWISELRSERAVLCFCLGFLLSRILSGLSIVYLPGAKKEGLFIRFFFHCTQEDCKACAVSSSGSMCFGNGSGFAIGRKPDCGWESCGVRVVQV